VRYFNTDFYPHPGLPPEDEGGSVLLIHPILLSVQGSKAGIMTGE